MLLAILLKQTAEKVHVTAPEGLCDSTGGIVKHHTATHNLGLSERYASTGLRDMGECLSCGLEHAHVLSLKTEDVMSYCFAKKMERTSLPPQPGLQNVRVWLSQTASGAREILLL